VAVAALIATLGFVGLSVGPNQSTASATNTDLTLTIVTPNPGDVINLPINGTVTGTVTIDWGDTTSTSVTTAGLVPHTYANAGSYTIVVTGTFTQFGGVLQRELRMYQPVTS